MREAFKKNAMAIYALVFIAFLFGLLHLHLERTERVLVVVTAAVLGSVTFFVLFRENFRGNWLGALVVFAVGLALGLTGVVHKLLNW